jgi:16S rRNA (cytosine1402-N4)-methyltransferase
MHSAVFASPYSFTADFRVVKESALEVIKKAMLGGVSELFQVGGWPWFGADADAMDGCAPSRLGLGEVRFSGSGSGGPLLPDGADGVGLGQRNLPFYHLPVLLAETLEALQPAPGKLFFDGTLGGGGHTEALLQRGARVVAMDQDQQALAYAKERLKSYSDRFCALRGNFRYFPQIVEEAGLSGFDGMLVDIGVSSHQLDDATRGFSFNKEAPLDMRMNTDADQRASDLINTAAEQELARIFFEYGEEPNARRIARAIVKARASRLIQTTTQLADIVAAVSPKRGKRHPATLVFQALRIAVNDELAALRDFLAAAPQWLKPGGRLVVITFHSLEDRIVKQGFAHLSMPELDRPEWPAPRPNPDCVLKVITRKPIEASQGEIEINPRARSARLRVAERLLS